MVRRAIRRLRDYRHGLAHRFGWAEGYVVSGWSDGALWIGFRCADCGEVTGAHVTDVVERGWGEHRFVSPPTSPPTVWTR